MDRSDVVALLAAGLIVAGVALVFVPAALVVAGVLLLAVVRISNGTEAS